MGDFTTAGEVESVTAHEVINTSARAGDPSAGAKAFRPLLVRVCADLPGRGAADGGGAPDRGKRRADTHAVCGESDQASLLYADEGGRERVPGRRRTCEYGPGDAGHVLGRGVSGDDG